MEAQKNIYSAIAEVMTNVNAISKGRKNDQQHFMFRGIDDVMNELHPIMAAAGLFVVPTVMHEERSQGTTSRGGSMFYTRLTIKFTFYAQDGSSLDAVVIGEAMDSGDKASNKALSVGLKYALLQVFCIPTEDDKDPDAESHNFQPQELSPEAQRERSKWETLGPKHTKGQQPAQQGPSGGPDTEEEHKEIVELLKSLKKDGTKIFGPDAPNRVATMRQGMTAQEVIAQLKKEIADARTPAAPEPQVQALQQAGLIDEGADAAFEIF